MAGSFFVIVGSLALWIALDYPTGSATRILAGYFPRLISGLLILLGLAIIYRGIGGHAGTEETVPASEWRPTLFVPLSMVSFGGTIETLGLVPAVFIAVLILSLAEKRKRWGEVLALGSGLSLVVYLIFIQALGLPIPVFPRY